MTTLNITEAALQRLADSISRVDRSAPEGVCFRLGLDEDENLELGVDTPVPEDQKFQHKESTVLVIADALAERFAGRTLDVNAAGDFVLS